MTIQRQYSLPNCTLVLEGLGDISQINTTEARPLMSILINAECHLPGQEKPLAGGREFFEGLVAAVSHYAQEILSGISAFSAAASHRSVSLQRVNANRHRLTVRPPDVPPDTGIATHLSREVDLTTVQLFDLVEAVDQFFADTQTLPDLTLNLQPVSKRYVRSEESIAKRAVPAAVGVSGLAVAALALAMIPAPQVRQPNDLFPKPGTTSTTGAPSATLGASPPTATASPQASPTATAQATPSPVPTTATSPDPAQAEALLAAAPEITDAAQIDTLRQELYSQVDQAWQTRTPITQDLVYRVGVRQDGKIVGYKPVNPAALEEAQKTPLLDLLAIPTPGSSSTSEPIAQYKVVFTGTGVLEVAPWKETMVSTVNESPEITNSAELEEIVPKLRTQILNTWKDENASFPAELIYRVRVNPDGTVIDYRPESQAASDNAQQVPLSKLGKLADENATPLQEPHALIKAVFTSNGRLELSPWRGWQ